MPEDNVMEQIGDALLQLYSPSELITWLISPHPLLGHRTAADMIKAGETAEVLRVAKQASESVYL